MAAPMAARRRGTVLIVDDTPENIHVLLQTLSEDHAILAATNGEKALELARSRQPDVILLDVMMPGMDGYEVCTRLKADEATREIPVIFVTALADEADEAKGLALGAIDYITKPFRPAIVKARVANHLALREATRLREDVERIMRHDLKTPLTSILSLPHLLLMAENLEEHQREWCERIEDAGYTVLSMVNLSTALYKMERGAYMLEPEEVDLLSLVGKILSANEDTTASRGLRWRISVDGVAADADNVFLVNGEGLLLFSMLSNLLQNAVEASPRDGEIAVACTSPTGPDGPSGPSILIRNQGAVPEEIRERFFAKYATSGKKRGTGLGTYSAKLIAEAHGGTIAMTSSEENGTEIRINLPA